MMDSAQEATPSGFRQEKLTLVEKVPMEGGVSFLCCDDEGNIYRLVSESGRCDWALEMDTLAVGSTYTFNVSVNNQPRFSREKMIVSWPPTVCQDRPEEDPVRLISMKARMTVEEVFPDRVIDGNYVNDPPFCPEFGVWKVIVPESRGSGPIATFYPSADHGGFTDTRRRIRIRGYDLPYKPSKHIPENRKILFFILGLTYPFAGTGQNVFNPQRCYIMVLGVIPWQYQVEEM